MISTRLRNGMDTVPLAAMVLGGLSFVLPFLVVKENRVVDGSPLRVFEISPLLSLTVLILAVALVVKVLRGQDDPPGVQSWFYAFIGSAFLVSAGAFLVLANGLLPQGAAPRVSPALGFWGLPLAAYVLLNHARIPRGKGRRLILALVTILPLVILFAEGRGGNQAMVREFAARKDRFGAEILTHLKLSGMAILIASLMGLPLGFAAARSSRAEGVIGALVDSAQTIPSLALFGLLMGPLAWLSRAVPLLRQWGIAGIGAAPALIALTLYALLPIVRNTLTGLAEVSLAAVEAGSGLGMTRRQVFFQVRLPMAAPHILNGLRTASVQVVGNAAVAALIGAGGLGTLIFQGLGQSAPDLIMLGVIPLIALAVTVDRLWLLLIRILVAPGLRQEISHDP